MSALPPTQKPDFPPEIPEIVLFSTWSICNFQKSDTRDALLIQQDRVRERSKKKRER
jgi:hypothetical protein